MPKPKVHQPEYRAVWVVECRRETDHARVTFGIFETEAFADEWRELHQNDSVLRGWRLVSNPICPITALANIKTLPEPFANRRIMTGR